MSTEYENISSGPVDDDALPTSEQLSAALNNIINPGASASAPSSAPGASQPSSTPSTARPGASQRPTAGSIAAEIERLQGSKAWADASDKGHASTLARLAELYRQQDDTPAPPARPMHPMQERAQVMAEAGRAVTEKRITSLQSSEAWRDGSHKDHGKVMAELRSLYQGAHPEHGGPRELPSAQEAASAGGITLPEAPKGMEAQFSDVDMSDFLVWSRIEQKLPATTVQRLVDDFHRFMVLEGRAFTGLREGDVQRWQKALVEDYSLSRQQADQLVRWYVQRVKESQS